MSIKKRAKIVEKFNNPSVSMLYPVHLLFNFLLSIAYISLLFSVQVSPWNSLSFCCLIQISNFMEQRHSLSCNKH